MTTFCFLPLLRTYSISCPAPDFMGELAPQNFVSASDIILVHSLPCSLGSSHTSPLSKCQAYFNLRTYFFFLKCFPNISAGLTSSHLSEASHSSDPMPSSQRNGKSILKSPLPFPVDFIFYIHISLPEISI